jgi:alkaline phosphatase
MLKMKLLFVVLFFCVAAVRADEFHKKLNAAVNPFATVNVMEGSRTYWRDTARNYISSKLGSSENTNKAKNVIFFIGDGMSIPTVAAARMLLGKEESQLSFEKFPHYGLSKTYCVDKQVADSACTGTAYFSGVKTNYRLLGLNANVESRQCVVTKEDHVDGIFSWAQKSQKATGIVTTTRITHASPAAAYAHVAHRDWENNNAISSACRSVQNVTDIAHQLVYNEVSQKIKVFLGGGRRNFINTTEVDNEGRPGYRTDGRNLIDEWATERNKIGNAKYVWHNQQLKELDIKNTDYLLGLFESDHCMYNLDIENNNLQYQEPSLTDMTVAAIKMLQKEENGYFLFVEGGRIDSAHHSTQPQRSLEDTKELSKAVEFARKMTDMDDTLIVVTSDHSHSFTFNGYPDRGQNILGVAELSDEDGKPYETLSYANGPGHSTTYNGPERVDISNQDFKNPSRRHSATVPLSSETHAAEDVGVFASGPWSHLFVGSYEQSSTSDGVRSTNRSIFTKRRRSNYTCVFNDHRLCSINLNFYRLDFN